MQASPSTTGDEPLRRPLSLVVGDVACVAGAMWTLACHITVLLGGNLNALAWLAAGLLVMAGGV